MGGYGLLLQSMGFLILIVILAYLAIRYGLRSLYRGANGGYMRILERVPLDHKSSSSVCLIQVGKDLYLVGTSQGNVTLLKTLDWKDLQYVEDGLAEKNLDLKTPFSKIMESIRKNSNR